MALLGQMMEAFADDGSTSERPLMECGGGAVVTGIPSELQLYGCRPGVPVRYQDARDDYSAQQRPEHHDGNHQDQEQLLQERQLGDEEDADLTLMITNCRRRRIVYARLEEVQDVDDETSAAHSQSTSQDEVGSIFLGEPMKKERYLMSKEVLKASPEKWKQKQEQAKIKCAIQQRILAYQNRQAKLSERIKRDQKREQRERTEQLIGVVKGRSMLPEASVSSRTRTCSTKGDATISEAFTITGCPTATATEVEVETKHQEVIPEEGEEEQEETTFNDMVKAILLENKRIDQALESAQHERTGPNLKDEEAARDTDASTPPIKDLESAKQNDHGAGEKPSGDTAVKAPPVTTTNVKKLDLKKWIQRGDPTTTTAPTRPSATTKPKRGKNAGTRSGKQKHKDAESSPSVDTNAEQNKQASSGKVRKKVFNAIHKVARSCHDPDDAVDDDGDVPYSHEQLSKLVEENAARGGKNNYGLLAIMVEGIETAAVESTLNERQPPQQQPTITATTMDDDYDHGRPATDEIGSLSELREAFLPAPHTRSSATESFRSEETLSAEDTILEFESQSQSETATGTATGTVTGTGTAPETRTGTFSSMGTNSIWDDLPWRDSSLIGVFSGGTSTAGTESFFSRGPFTSILPGNQGD